jgi:hypothetical protein
LRQARLKAFFYPLRWPYWRPLLLPALALLYAIWLGGGVEWNNMMGQFWVRLEPWLPSLRLDLLALALLAALLFRLGGTRLRRRMPLLLGLLLAGGQIACLQAAWKFVSGPMPWGIDHPAFLFRLKEFRELFPLALGGYNPWWNAGTEHFIGVTSGTHAFGLLNLPPLLCLDPHLFHGPALAFWLIVGFPWLGVLAVRAAGVRWTGALCAGLLMCAVSRAQFLFFWQSGNVGAMTSAMLTLPVVALGYRLIVLRRGGWGMVVALGVAAWLVCLWTPGVLVCAGLVPGWIAMRRRWTIRSNRLLVAAGLLALVLALPWFWITLFPSRGIVNYVATGVTGSRWLMLQAGVRQLLLRLQEWHPLLLVLGAGGAVVVAPRSVRRWTLPLLLILAAIICGTGWWSQSQLDRMALPMAVAAVFPTTVLCGRLFARGSMGRSRIAGLLHALAQGVVLALLMMGLRVAQMHYACRGGFKLWPAPDTIYDFADWIRREVPPEGRLAFAGTTDWKYEWGKPTYLPILSGREMMADDYYSYPRGLIERNYPPKAYRVSLDSWLAFTRAYGITHWAAADPRHKGFLAGHPEWFELVRRMSMQSSRIEIYRVLGLPPPTRFLEGTGSVTARENALVVRPEPADTERVVIRYQWRDGLVCRTPGATIEPFNVDGHLQFIAVRPGGNPVVRIGYRPRFAPLKPNFDGTFHH